MSSSLRELRDADAEAVAALFVAAFGDARRLDAEEIRSWLAIRELKPEYLRVLDIDGRVVGYGDIWPDNGVVALDLAAPGHWNVFFDWSEEFARTNGLAKARVFTPADHELAAVAEARGYRPWRSSFTMEIALPVDRPVLPERIEIRPYRPTVDAEVVRLAENEAFGEAPFHHDVSPERFADAYLGARGFEPGLWLLGWDGDELAGFALAYAEHVGDAGLGWVGTLGVRAPWRRRGLGEALLRAAFVALHDRGLRRAGLGVDTENVAGALRLYERIGMRVVRRYDNLEVDV